MRPGQDCHRLASKGQSPAASTCLGSLPVTIKPPIRILSPVCTRARLEILSNCAGLGVGVPVGVGLGVAVGVALGVAEGVALGVAPGVAEGVADELGVAVGVAEGVALGVADGVGVGVALGVGVGVGVGSGPEMVKSTFEMSK